MCTTCPPHAVPRCSLQRLTLQDTYNNGTTVLMTTRVAIRHAALGACRHNSIQATDSGLARRMLCIRPTKPWTGKELNEKGRHHVKCTFCPSAAASSRQSSVRREFAHSHVLCRASGTIAREARIWIAACGDLPEVDSSPVHGFCRGRAKHLRKGSMS